MDVYQPIERRKGRIFILIFVFLGASIVATGYFYFRNYKNQHRVGVERQLSAIAELKVGELTLWREERLGDGALLFKNAAFSTLVRRFFERPEDADAQRQLQSWIEKYEHYHQYDQLRLLDAQGVTRMSSAAGLADMSATVTQRVPEVLRSGQVKFQDFYRNEHDQRIHLAVMVPIFDERNGSRPLGVLVLRIDPGKYLYPFIKRWPTPSATAETLLVRREGNEVVFLDELRFQTNTALNLRASLDRTTMPAVQAALGREGIMEGRDYRGVPVVAALRTVPDSPWSLVARMDTAEVYAPMRERLWQIVVMIGVLLFGAGACVGLVWRQRSVRFHKDLAETENRTRRMATVVRDSNDAITIQDFGGRITAWNRGAELMYGYSEEEALLENIERLTAPGKVEEQKDFTRRLTAGEKISSFETQRVTKDGHILDVWLTVTKLMDDTGKPIGIASTERDITARKREEEDLRRMATVVRDSNDAITIQDFGGRITAWNRGAELMYGYSEEEALLENIERLTSPGKVEEQKDFTRRLMAGEKVSSFETQRVTKDGGVLDVWLTVTKLMDDAGKPIGIASTERDITARKRGEEQVRQLNAELEQRVVERTAQLEAANKELEAFSYSVSHDLRAPLRHVQGYVDMLAREDEGQLSDRGRRYMKTIADVSREMGVLIDDLLAFSRMGRAEMIETRVNLDVLVQDTLRDLETTTRERNIVWKIPPLPTVQGDPAILKLALANLLGNAVKFTRPRDPAQIEIGSAGTEGGRVILFVRDNGVGFDPRYAQKLFGVFQRLHRADEFEGTGIGLANVRRIIARHGGRTWAEGALDRGATFYFTLKPSSSANPTN